MKFRKYDVFLDTKTQLISQYPELSKVVQGLDFAKVNTSIDNFLRYVVFLYDLKNPIVKEIPDVEERRNDALKKFDIKKEMWKDDEFGKLELDMSSRFMLLNCDSLGETWLSARINLNAINKQLRNVKKDRTFKDAVDSLAATKSLFELEEIVAEKGRLIFGDYLGIERYNLEKEMNNRHGVEKHAE